MGQKEESEEEARRRFERLAGGLLQVSPEELTEEVLEGMTLYCIQKQDGGLCLGVVEETEGGSLVCPKCGHVYERRWLQERWERILG